MRNADALYHHYSAPAQRYNKSTLKLLGNKLATAICRFPILLLYTYVYIIPVYSIF